MARQPNETGEHFHEPFPTALRKLMAAKGVTQTELLDVFGVKSRQSITGYIDGSTAPTPEKIVAVARYFGVSADYLLGLSPYPTNDSNLEATCKYTGLSMKSVKKICALNKYADDMAPTDNDEDADFAVGVFSALDEMLSSSSLSSFLVALYSVNDALRLAPFSLTPEARAALGDTRSKEMDVETYKMIKYSLYDVCDAAKELAEELYNTEPVEKALKNLIFGEEDR